MITRRTFVQGAAAAALTTLTRPAAVAAAPNVTWRMVSHFPRSGIEMQEATWIADRVRQLTGGGFNIEVYARGELVPPHQILSAIQQVFVECGQQPLDEYYGEDSALALASSIPFGPVAPRFKQWWAAGGGQRVNAVLRPMGVRAIPCGDMRVRTGGWYPDPIERPAEFSRLKLGLAQGDSLHAAVLRRFGLDLVEMDYVNMAVAIQSGEVDAVDASTLAEDERFDLPLAAPVCYRSNWWQPNRMIHMIIGLQPWAALPPRYRNILTRTFNQSYARMLKARARQDATALRRMRRDGVDFPNTFPAPVLRRARQVSTVELRRQAAANPKFRRLWNSLKRFQR